MIAAAARTVQGLCIYDVVAQDFYGVRLSAQRQEDIHLRTPEAVLERIRELDARPLGKPRPPGKRVAARCGQFTMLLVELLRQEGVRARARCGFGLLKQSTALDQAARGHAFYQLYNNISGHFQSATDPHFTGTNPGTRAEAAGYNYAEVQENIIDFRSTSNLANHGPKSVRGLLSAPYHALSMLRGMLDVGVSVMSSDLTGTTAGGIHLGTAGGVWQALAYGFLGLRAHADALTVDPCLPAAWDALSLRFRFHDHPIGVRADHRAVRVSCITPLTIRTPDGAPHPCNPPGQTFDLSDGSPP